MDIKTPLLKYPGSKWSLAEWIISHFPPHTTYLEPFFGSGAILFNKAPSQVETINDIDGDIVNLFRVIREHPEELARLVYFTPWARDEYSNILTSASVPETFIHSGDPLEDARRFLVRCWMAFGAHTSDRSGWASDVQGKQRANIAKRWLRIPNLIHLVADRLRGVQIENQPALQIIERYRFSQVLIYADPPYVRSTRNSRAYKHEMTDADHMELLDALDKHPGPVFLSGYDCELYNSRLGYWRRESARGTAMGYKPREEVLWINPVAARQVNEKLDLIF
jgi:DNA adenine methylase